MDRIISYLGLLWLFVLVTLANSLPESVESLSQYHMPGDVRDLPRRKQHSFVLKRRDIHSHHVCSENFPSRRVSVDVLSSFMHKFFLSF